MEEQLAHREANRIIRISHECAGIPASWGSVSVALPSSIKPGVMCCVQVIKSSNKERVGCLCAIIELWLLFIFSLTTATVHEIAGAKHVCL
jgi:small neutral amino acid transporter SnatA (MarC family)